MSLCWILGSLRTLLSGIDGPAQAWRVSTSRGAWRKWKADVLKLHDRPVPIVKWESGTRVLKLEMEDYNRVCGLGLPSELINDIDVEN